MEFPSARVPGSSGRMNVVHHKTINSLSIDVAKIANRNDIQTTSSMSGKVVDQSNEAIIGATIQAIHEPSGTHYGAITNVDGRYSIQGMRAGGPYKLQIGYNLQWQVYRKRIYIYSEPHSSCRMTPGHGPDGNSMRCAHNKIGV